jgi:hypothetical protein
MATPSKPSDQIGVHPGDAIPISFSRNNTAMTTLRDIPTTMYLGAFVLMIACSAALESLGEFLWVRHSISSYPQEIVSGAIGWSAIIGIFALVPISPFRPRSRFSLRGDCKQRAIVLGLSVLAAVGFFLYI